MVDSVFILKIQEGRSGLSLTVQGVISIFSYLEMFPVSPLNLEFGCAKLIIQARIFIANIINPVWLNDVRTFPILWFK